jgi:hypothetical protein
MQKLNVIYDARYQEFKNLLVHEWEWYFSHISDSVVSIKYSVCLWCLCEWLKPESIIDLGSGFTSLALRLYREFYSPELTVYTVDSDPYWLMNSCCYCKDHGVEDQHFYTWNDFVLKGIRGDIVSMDIDNSRPRRQYIEKSVQLARFAILFDDMHKAHIRQPVHKFFKTHNRCHELLDIKDKTHDKWGRYALLVRLEAP